MIPFSRRIMHDMSPSPLAAALAARRAAGEPILDLTVSNPTRAQLAYPSEEIMHAWAHPGIVRYDPEPRGMHAAREGVAAYYAQHGCAVDPDRVHLTASTSEAYGFLFKLLTDQGDAVLMPRPSYPLIEYLAALEGVELHPYNLRYSEDEGWRTDPLSLEAALTPRTRAVIAVSPNNPTGSYLHPDDLAMMQRFCADNRCALITDEVFFDFPLRDEAARITTAANDSAALTFTLSGFSKVLALPQVKFGWIVTQGPDALVRDALDRLDLIADTYLSISTPVQLAAERLWNVAGRMQEQITARCRGNLSRLADAVCGHERMRVLRADGGWYAVLALDTARDEEELALTLLEESGVYVHPGYFFDFRSGAHLVISLLTPPDVLDGGIRLLMTHLTL